MDAREKDIRRRATMPYHDFNIQKDVAYLMFVIDGLREEIQKERHRYLDLQYQLDSAVGEKDALLARLAAIEKAVEPFAKFLEAVVKYNSDGHAIRCYGDAQVLLTVGDLRRLDAAIRGKEK